MAAPSGYGKRITRTNLRKTSMVLRALQTQLWELTDKLLYTEFRQVGGMLMGLCCGKHVVLM